MRVIFQSPRIRTKHKHYVTGEVVDGTAQFTAAVYEPGEQVPNSRGAPRGLSMREWRSRLRPGQGIGMGQLKEIYVGGLPLVVVPPELTDPLPDDATLAISWTFVPEGLCAEKRSKREGQAPDAHAASVSLGQEGQREAAVELAITTERAGDKGWIAFAAEVRATAQGATEDEAKRNLRELLERYPDLLDELRRAADRRVELIRL